MRAEIMEWRDLLEYLTKIWPRKKRIYFIIDEFSYIIKNDPAVVSALQKIWDTFFSNTEVFFLASGSIFGLMSENVLSSTSPLYGRRSKDLLIRQLKFEHASNFLDSSFEDKLKTYMTIGGIPEYLLKTKGYKTADEFSSQEFMKKDGYFYREPYFLLSQEFKEIKTYFAILNAISYGNTKPTEIANFAGVKTREIYPYLENLIRLNFIERVSPITGNKRAGIYLIRDVFLDFWFNFVFKNRELIENEKVKINKGDLNSYFGKRFEMFVRNEVVHKSFESQNVGRWWYKDVEIDVVALNEQSKEILFGECKWQENVSAVKILNDLKEKAKHVQWHNDKRKEYYAIFAKNFKDRIKEEDVMLFDLNDLEKLLM